MKIGLCGAHGTGKTTLAKKYSEHAQIPYLDAGAGRFLKTLGVDLSNDNMPVVERLETQFLLVQHIGTITSKQSANSGSFITDRTPVDVLAYSRDIAAPHYRDDHVMEAYSKIHIQCMEISLANFNLTLMLRPGVPLSEEDRNRPQRGSFEPFHVEQIDFLMSALINSFNRTLKSNSLSRFALLSPEAISMERRIAALDNVTESIRESATAIVAPFH